MAQSVKHLPLARVMILGSWDRAPHWGPCSVGSLLLPLPLPLPTDCGLPPLSQVNKILKKKKKKEYWRQTLKWIMLLKFHFISKKTYILKICHSFKVLILGSSTGRCKGTQQNNASNYQDPAPLQKKVSDGLWTHRQKPVLRQGAPVYGLVSEATEGN